MIKREEERKCPFHRGKILAVTVVPVDAGIPDPGCPLPRLGNNGGLETGNEYQ